MRAVVRVALLALGVALALGEQPSAGEQRAEELINLVEGILSPLHEDVGKSDQGGIFAESNVKCPDDKIKTGEIKKCFATATPPSTTNEPIYVDSDVQH